jgi:hypothetical protein
LGKKLNLCLNDTFALIIQSPFQFPVLFDEFRKARLAKPFPYSVIYRIFNDEIIVIAIAHDKRDPDFWTTRS